ncbi:MAG TPA: type II secretion system secretin GspD [Polyangiaceae bacterium]|jgi:general secretion pathway protein D|nr:type II secretion system secretin GspD [Polyangiaceae bacterium]
MRTLASLRSLLTAFAVTAVSAPAFAQDPPPNADPAAPAPAAPDPPAARPRRPRPPRPLQRRNRDKDKKAKRDEPEEATPPTATLAAPAAGAAADKEKDPPGAAGPLPTNMDKIAQAADVPYKAKPGGHLVKFNLQDADLAELVNHISGLTGRRFIYGAKVRQIKATVVSPEPVSLDEAYQAFLSILEANGMTVVPHGRFLKIIDSGGVVTSPTPIVSRGEPVPDADRYITRLYRLENASPDDIVTVLNKFKSKDGDITPYTPGRLLIITDTATQVRRLIRIIEEVDIGGSGQHMWIEPVHHGTSADMAKRLNELFEIGTSGGAAAAGAAPGTAKTPSGLSRVVADDASNSLIVVGTEDSYLKMLELLKRLDTEGTDKGHIHVLALQHAIAEELSQTLTQMLAGQASKQPGAAGVGSAGGMFEGDVRVTPDKSTNSLIVTSSGRDFATFRLVVDKLDRSRRQVFIEAVIMDLGVSDTLDLGVAFHGGHSFGGGPNDPFLLTGFQAGKSLAFPQDPSLLQGFAAGVRGSDLPGTQDLLGPGISIPAFGIVLSAMASSGRTNILATPHIIATDNTPAEINIGENIPLQTNVGGASLGSLAGLGAAGAAGGVNPLLALGGGFGYNAPRQDVGNKVKVTPHINESNQVRLEIDQESSAPGAAVGNLGAVPIVKRTAMTTVVVADQQTVVIGGLMRDEMVTTKEKVPVLGDLPVLGALFRHTNTVKRKTNLLLVLTPHVIRDQSDLRRIFERKMQERQEFIDRYFVFSDVDWKPPRDWSRTNGLVEDIRQAYLQIDAQTEIEEESKSYEDNGERQPSEPIELPTSVRESNSAELVAKPKGTPMAPAKGGAPAKPGGAKPAAPRPARGGRRGELGSPIIINPIARSVNSVERMD